MAFYLAFYKDNGAPEDCNVYHSWLIEADDEKHAKDKLQNWLMKINKHFHIDEMDQFDFNEMDVIR